MQIHNKVKKSSNSTKMDEVRTKKIKIVVNQEKEKKKYIIYAYSEEIKYRKKAALERVSTESEEKELVDLAPLRISLIRENKSAKTADIDEIFF